MHFLCFVFLLILHFVVLLIRALCYFTVCCLVFHVLCYFMLFSQIADLCRVLKVLNECMLDLKSYIFL